MDKERPLIFASLNTVLLTMLLVLSSLAHAQDKNAVSTKQTKWSGGGLRIELQALTPDLTRAFFIGRGFPKKDVEFLVANGCVFRSAIGHASTDKSKNPVTIQLKKWRVINRANSHPLRTREMWKEIWTERKLDPSASIAFHWALIPTEQTYQPTDYNWGMLTFMEPPGTKFDLEMAWLEGEKPRTHMFKGLHCGEGAKE